MQQPLLILDTFLAALMSQHPSNTKWERKVSLKSDSYWSFLTYRTKLKAFLMNLSSTTLSQPNDLVPVADHPESLPIKALSTLTPSKLVPSKSSTILQGAFIGSSAATQAMTKSNSESILRSFRSPTSFSNKVEYRAASNSASHAFSALFSFSAHSMTMTISTSTLREWSMSDKKIRLRLWKKKKMLSVSTFSPKQK